ncbi:MAG: hypothetical protein AAGC85_08765, partial [Bacteroidota bacterium]
DTVEISRSSKILKLDWAPRYYNITGEVKSGRVPVNQVEISLLGSKSSTLSDVNGQFILKIPSKRVKNIFHKIFLKKAGYQSNDVNINLLDQKEFYSVQLEKQ